MVPTRELAIDVTCTETDSRGERPALALGEPVSPVGRLFLEPRLSCYIVCVFGLGAPVDLAAVRQWLEAILARHPRFCSVQVMDKSKKGARPKWVRTTVNLDDHVIVPDLNPTSTLADVDRAMEDYLSSLSTVSMDHSRRLWELHVLDFPTAEAAAALVVRMHHSLGDSISLMSLLVASARPTADPTTLPPTAATRRTGPVHALPPRSPVSTVLVWVMSILVLAWHTVVDMVCLVATAWSIMRDPPTLCKGTEGVELRPKRFVNRTLSLDDVKYVKNIMKCTVNDVLLGVASAALSRYYFRKAGESGEKSIEVRSTLVANLRKAPGLHTLPSMMKSGKDNDVKWGNRFGYMILPFHLCKHDDLLRCVCYIASPAMARESKKWIDWMPALTLRCDPHTSQSTSEPGSLGTAKPAVSVEPDPGERTGRLRLHA